MRLLYSLPRLLINHSPPSSLWRLHCTFPARGDSSVFSQYCRSQWCPWQTSWHKGRHKPVWNKEKSRTHSIFTEIRPYSSGTHPAKGKRTLSVTPKLVAYFTRFSLYNSSSEVIWNAGWWRTDSSWEWLELGQSGITSFLFLNLESGFQEAHSAFRPVFHFCAILLA